MLPLRLATQRKLHTSHFHSHFRVHLCSLPIKQSPTKINNPFPALQLQHHISRPSNSTLPTALPKPAITNSAALHIHTTSANPEMPGASDEDYESFLEKANQDTSTAKTSTASNKNVSTKSVDTDVPAALNTIDAFYTSETDERFQPVSLLVPDGVSDAGVSVAVIRRLSGRDDVEGLEVRLFDPRGEYDKVVEGVRGECRGEPQAFRVGLGGARCEYWVVGLAKDQKRIVGVKALAVES